MRVYAPIAAMAPAVVALTGFASPATLGDPSTDPDVTVTESASPAPGDTSPEPTEDVSPADPTPEPASPAEETPGTQGTPDSAGPADIGGPTPSGMDETPQQDLSESAEAEPLLDTGMAAMSLLATAAPSVTIDGSFVDLLVTRTATGTGHGTIAQCGINSGNPDIFPDGNLAGDPADDSPFDECACGRDTMQYQVELNFGQEALPAPRTVTFEFNIVDQGSSIRALRFTQDVQRMCSSSVPGVYSGTTYMYSNTTNVRCTLNIEAGVSGTVLLPPIDIEAVPNQPFSRYLRPTVKFEGQTHTAPPVTILSLPQVDARMRFSAPAANATQTPNPVLTIIDGVPGLAIVAETTNNYSSFNANKWAQFKGISTRTTNVMDYTVGAYVLGDDVDSPQALPPNAIVLTGSSIQNSNSVFRDIDGNIITTRVAPMGSLYPSVALWMPISTIVDRGGFGLWTRTDPQSITDELGNPNFGSEQPWDPGTGEACSVRTSSHGLNGVYDGTTTPNNNCFRHWYTYGACTEGPTEKFIDGNYLVKTFAESRAFPVSLSTPARVIPDTGDLMFCDAWDAPEQAPDPRSPSQTLNLAVAPTFTAMVGGRSVNLPADIWRVEYVHSNATMTGTLPSPGAIARCADGQDWTTDPTTIAGGAQTINTARFILDRDGLRSFLESEGLRDEGDYLPALNARLGFFATTAASGELAADGSAVQVYDAYVVDWGRDVPGTNFIHTRYYNVRAPYSSYKIAKAVALPGTNAVHLRSAGERGAAGFLQAAILPRALSGGCQRAGDLHAHGCRYPSPVCGPGRAHRQRHDHVRLAMGVGVHPAGRGPVPRRR